MNMSLDFQRELPQGFVVDIAYVGTLGRRLLTKADFAESLPLTDPASHTNFYQAFDQIIALAGTSQGFTWSMLRPSIRQIRRNWPRIPTTSLQAQHDAEYAVGGFAI